MGEGQGSKFITKEPKNHGEKQSGAGGERAPWLRILKGSEGRVVWWRLTDLIWDLGFDVY